MRVTNQPLHVVLFFFFLFFPPFFFSHLFHSKTTLWYGPKGLKHAHAWLHAHLESADEQVKCKRQTFREREETLEKRKKIKEYLKGWMGLIDCSPRWNHYRSHVQPTMAVAAWLVYCVVFAEHGASWRSPSYARNILHKRVRGTKECETSEKTISKLRARTSRNRLFIQLTWTWIQLYFEPLPATACIYILKLRYFLKPDMAAAVPSDDSWYFTVEQLRNQPSMEDGVTYDVGF